MFILIFLIKIKMHVAAIRMRLHITSFQITEVALCAVRFSALTLDYENDCYTTSAR